MEIRELCGVLFSLSTVGPGIGLGSSGLHVSLLSHHTSPISRLFFFYFYMPDFSRYLYTKLLTPYYIYYK